MKKVPRVYSTLSSIRSLPSPPLGQSDITMPPIANEKLGAGGKKPFTVFVEGNIGSGKTTFLDHFQQFDDVCLLTEPVEKWRSCGGVNLLDLMYKEAYRWAMPFQTYVTLTMLDMHTSKTDKPVKLMERSLFSARYVEWLARWPHQINLPSFLTVTASWRVCLLLVRCIVACTMCCRSGTNLSAATFTSRRI